MMLLRVINQVLKLPALPIVHQQYGKITMFGPCLESVSQASHYSTARHSHRKHLEARGTEPKRNRESTMIRTDPLRPVSDKLMKSLMKRHKDKFTALQGTRNSPAHATSLSSLSVQDLIHVIYTSPKNAPRKAEQMREIEKRLTKHLYKMSLEQMLQACHGLYLQGHNFHQFLSQMLSVVDETFNELSPSASEITRLLLYIFIHGNAPSMLMHRVEEHMLKNLDDFHINDLGVICVGFFRGNARISSQDLLDVTAEKLLKEIDSLEPFLLLDFLKMFRHASYIKVSFYEQLANYLVQSNFVSRYTTINPVMHIAFTYASLPIRHASLFEYLFSQVESLLTHQRNIRSKDISKFVWACGTLQFMPKDCEARYNQLVKYFEDSTSGSKNYPESIAEFLMGLVYMGIFSTNLLHKCLAPGIATKLLESGSDREKSFQLLLLNETVKIECPDYSGNLLSQSQLESLWQHPSVSRDLETELETRNGLQTTVLCLERCLGADRVRCLHPLIHFKTAVIELWYCAEHGFISIPPSVLKQQVPLPGHKCTFTQPSITDDVFSALVEGTGQTAKSSQALLCKRVALLVSGSGHFPLNDSQQALGHLHTMKRQLAKVGYIVVEILPEDALHIEVSSHEERCHHLSALLSKVLQATITLSKD